VLEIPLVLELEPSALEILSELEIPLVLELEPLVLELEPSEPDIPLVLEPP
jgi:hypothetical protein